MAAGEFCMAGPSWVLHFLRFLFAVFLILQGVVLDQYLVKYVSPHYYSYLALYLISLVVWFLFTIGKIKIAYLWTVWASYSCFALVPMLGTILGTVIYSLDEYEKALAEANGSSTVKEVRYLNSKEELLGPNVFMLTLCLSPLLFLLLLTTTPEQTDRDTVVNLCMMGTLELFDGIKMLLVFIGDTRMETTVPTWLKILIASVVCCSFFLSPLEILETYGVDENTGMLQKRHGAYILFDFLKTLLINGAFLSIRLTIWLVYGLPASIFIAKNAIALIMTLFRVFAEYRLFGFGAPSTTGKPPRETRYRNNRVSDIESNNRVELS